MLFSCLSHQPYICLLELLAYHFISSSKFSNNNLLATLKGSSSANGFLACLKGCKFLSPASSCRFICPLSKSHYLLLKYPCYFFFILWECWIFHLATSSNCLIVSGHNCPCLSLSRMAIANIFVLSILVHLNCLINPIPC